MIGLFLLCLCFRIFVILDDRFSIIQFQYYHSVDKRLVIFHTEDAWLYRRPVSRDPKVLLPVGTNVTLDTQALLEDPPRERVPSRLRYL